MDILLKIHKQLEKKDYKELWEKGTFIFDTNSILDLYRLPETARDDLIKILSDEKINKRVWLPFQVFLEFSQNRIGVISSQKNAFRKVEKILNSAVEGINNAFEKMKSALNEMELDKRHSLISPEDYLNDDLIKQPVKEIENRIKSLKKLENKQLDVTDKDNLQDRILEIFSGKIGDSFTKEELNKIYKEGEERYKDEIPPGYKDKDKEFINAETGKKEPDFYLFEDKKILRKYGDLLFWMEIIKKAQNDNLEYIVLVSNEKKEGWIQEKRGKKIGVRYELLNEIYTNAKSVKLFHIYNSPSFMKFAKEFLNIDITEQSIEETKELLKYETEKKTRVVNQFGSTEFLAKLYSKFKEKPFTSEALKSESVFNQDDVSYIRVSFSFSIDKSKTLMSEKEIKSALRDFFPVANLYMDVYESEYDGAMEFSIPLNKNELEKCIKYFSYGTGIDIKINALQTALF